MTPDCDTANARVGRWAEWESRRRERQMGAVAVADDEPMLLVAGEVLVGRNDRDLIEECLAKGGELIPALPLDDPPVEVRRTRDLNRAEFPMPVRIRFAQPVREETPERTLPELHERWRREGPGPRILVSDVLSASVASFVGRRSAEGRNIILNAAGVPTTLPLRTPLDGAGAPGGNDPGAWPSFQAPARILEAWQLVESVRLARSIEPVVWIAIFDAGYWLGANGETLAGQGESASDFGPGVPSFNIMQRGAPVGGAGGGLDPWHGHGCASIAAALAGNGLGAAGTGGTVARPFLFRMDISMDQTVDSLRHVTAWGLDIVTMSYRTIVYPFLWWDGVPSDYDETFQFAHDNGVICIASAGNDTKKLPDDAHVRPATRTPGVITVGALDGGGPRGDSNFGPSVDIWAPGTNIPVAPRDMAGVTFNGTSAAAPFVAGVAAMMRAVDPLVHPAKVKETLVRTGWQGPAGSKVTRGLDAYAAVLDVLGGTLPADLWEPNQTAATAAPLYDAGGGVLRPPYGFATRARGDVDYWKFELKGVSDVSIALDWYARLGHLSLEIEATDPDNMSAEEMVASSVPGTGTSRLNGTLSPGSYALRVTGSALTAYELAVTPKPATIRQDMFEPNDSFDGAAPLHFDPLTFPALRHWGPGEYDATLHRIMLPLFPVTAVNDDYFELNVPAAAPDLRQSQVVISGGDHPLDIELFDSARQPIGNWPGVKAVTIKPPPGQISYLKIAGAKPTRYRLSIGRWVDPSMLPNEIERAKVIPDWWENPRFEFDDRVIHVVIDVDPGRDDGRILLAPPGEGIDLDLLDMRGGVVGSAVRDEAGRLSVATEGLETGLYLLRATRTAERTGVRPALKLLSPLRFR